MNRMSVKLIANKIREKNGNRTLLKIEGEVK